MKKLHQYLLSVATAAVLGGAFLVPTAFADTTYTVDDGVFFAGTSVQFNSRGGDVAPFMTAVQVGDTIIVANSCADGTYTVTATTNTGDTFPSVGMTTPTCYNAGAGVAFTIHTAPPPAPPDCGLGCAGIPTAYTANFSSTTARGAAEGAVSDLGSFALHIIFPIVGIIIGLIAIGMGLMFIRRYLYARGFSDGVGYSAGEIKKITDKYK